MDRTRLIEKLGARLLDAASRSDWDLLERAVRELGPQLQVLADQGAWSVPERGALARLRAAHDAAASACHQAAGDLQTRLDDMRDHKEGWMAYALAGENDDGEPRP